MRITLLYFAWVRERTGMGAETLDLPDGLATPLDVARWLAGRSAGHGDAFADPTRLRCAVNQQMHAMDAPLGDAGEIAFFPPVTGG